jgi:hypothetical protein
MGDLVQWANMWGAKVKLRNDMPDDMLKDAIETSRRVLDGAMDFDIEGEWYPKRVRLGLARPDQTTRGRAPMGSLLTGVSHLALET